MQRRIKTMTQRKFYHLLESIKFLSPKQMRQLRQRIDSELAHSGPQNGEAHTGAETVFDVASRAGLIGCIQGAPGSPTDLSTNPKHVGASGVASRAVADTGPLVAVVRSRETAHKKCAEALKTFRSPLLTCWPVLTEAAWRLRQEAGGMRVIGKLIESGLVELVDLDEAGPGLDHRVSGTLRLRAKRR
jgi:hypothetical protein